LTLLKQAKIKGNKNAVIKIDHANNGSLWNGRFLALIFLIVQMKLLAPKIDAAPERCRLKITKSTAPPSAQ
jgi:hypothetical protein